MTDGSPATGGGVGSALAGAARAHPVTAGLSLLLVSVAVVFVLLSLREPDLPIFVPTTSSPAPVGSRLVGPDTFTVDARAADAWQYFDFSTESLVDPSSGTDWDLAFRRFYIIANGGPGFPGRGGVVDLGAVDFDSVRAAPADGYQVNRSASDTTNAAIKDWYRYSWLSHVLEPHPRVYAVRTADGRFAKVEILSYYCPGARPGCLTFRYVYQGGGDRSLVP